MDRLLTPLSIPSYSYKASEHASIRSSNVQRLCLLRRQLSMVRKRIRALRFTGMGVFTSPPAPLLKERGVGSFFLRRRVRDEVTLDGLRFLLKRSPNFRVPPDL